MQLMCSFAEAASEGSRAEHAYPFLWFFFDWLCWDEFFDSAHC